MLVVDEARSQSDEHKATAMYNVLKPYCAAPPDMLRMNEKRLKARYVRNCCRLFITTNEVEGLYVPKDDRRLFIMHTEQSIGERRDRMDDYWKWVRAGGPHAVRKWLKERDISQFDATKEPPKTPKHNELSHSWGIDPDSGLGVALDHLCSIHGVLPKVMFYEDIKSAVNAAVFDKVEETKRLLGPRALNRTMQRAGYVTMANPETKKGDWRAQMAVDGKTTHIEFATAFRRHDVGLQEALDLAPILLQNHLTVKARAASIKIVDLKKQE
jgi:hypothetical protein